MRTSQAIILAFGALVASVNAEFDPKCNNNVAIYWGQDSSGAQGLPLEGRLKDYCQDDTADIMLISFVNEVDEDGNIKYNFANHGDLDEIGSDVKFCQSQGKTVLISVGGAIGSYQLSSASQATALANTLWDRFLGGDGDRVFGNGAKLDGVDLDIEGDTGGIYYDVVANRIHELGGLVSAAPECPDNHRMTKALPKAWLDFVNVQFYNNECSLSNYPNINYDYWDNYATKISKNKDVKILIGGVANPADGPQGYTDLASWKKIIRDIRSKYDSYGGVMEFEASVAFIDSDNHVYAPSLSKFVKSGSSCDGKGRPPRKSTSIDPTPTKTISSTKTDGTTETDRSTKITSSAKTSPTSNPGGSCPVQGGSCSVQYGCNGNSFAQCSNGKWTLTPCPSGTTCKGDSSSAYCDYGNTEPCGATSVRASTNSTVKAKGKGKSNNRNHARDFHLNY